MRVLQILLLLIIPVGVKSDGEPFDKCTPIGGCPADATCDVGFSNTCICNEGFYPYDTGVEVAGDPQTLCDRKYLSMHV